MTRSAMLHAVQGGELDLSFLSLTLLFSTVKA